MIERNIRIALVLGLCALVLSLVAHGFVDTWAFTSPAQQARYQQLTRELRCPKCDGQSIGDSNAPIANDLRRVIYQQLQEGYSDEQIIDFMVQRYGEFILYRPKMAGKTLWLWLGPVLFAGIGLLVLVIVLRRSRAPVLSTAQVGLSEQEQQRLNRLLARDTGDSRQMRGKQRW